VERLQHQTTQMRNLDYRDYLTIHLPKPSPEVQSAIVEVILELPRFLRQIVKTQNSLNGELSHGVVSTKVHS
jgi:hypothetical protein